MRKPRFTSLAPMDIHILSKAVVPGRDVRVCTTGPCSAEVGLCLQDVKIRLGNHLVPGILPAVYNMRGHMCCSKQTDQRLGTRCRRAVIMLNACTSRTEYSTGETLHISPVPSAVPHQYSKTRAAIQQFYAVAACAAAHPASKRASKGHGMQNWHHMASGRHTAQQINSSSLQSTECRWIS